MKKLFLELCFLCLLLFTSCGREQAESGDSQMELRAVSLDCPEDFVTYCAWCDDEMICLAGDISINHTILKKSHSDKEWTAIPYNWGGGRVQAMEKTEDGYLFLCPGSGSYKLKKGIRTALRKKSLWKKQTVI